jgi:cadmium resistance protein CadD (predicted permease)
MEHFVRPIGLAIVLFVSTNIDDGLVLLGFFADPQFKPRQIVIGQYLGMAGLFGASAVASLLSHVVPSAYIGLLGLAPLTIGLKKAWDLRKDAQASPETSPDHAKAPAGHGNVVAVMAVTLANGGDNIGIYTPLFATRSGYDIAVMGVVFTIMTLLWLGIAHWLTLHRAIGAPIRRYGHRVLPFVLIALGGIILYQAGTLALLDR